MDIFDNAVAKNIMVKLQQYDNATVMSKLKSKDYDMATMNDTLIPVDPTYDLPFFITTGNLCAYSNKSVDDLVSKVRIDTTDAETKSDLGQLQKILQKDQPILTMYASKQIACVNKRVVTGKPKDYGTLMFRTGT